MIWRVFWDVVWIGFGYWLGYRAGRKIGDDSLRESFQRGRRSAGAK